MSKVIMFSTLLESNLLQKALIKTSIKSSKMSAVVYL